MSQQETIPVKNLAFGIGVGFGVVAVFIFAVLLITELGLKEHHGESEEQIQERIKPVGQVQVEGEEAVVTAPVKPAAAPTATPKSGKELYDAVCTACHAAAVLGAPKLGDKADWKTRFAQGEATLFNHAINGFKQMPARGGADISDEEVKRVVRYMLAEAGLVSAAPPPKTPPLEKPPVVTPATAKLGKEIYEAKCKLCHETGVAGAPKYGDKASWAERVAKGEATLIQTALKGLNAMPPRGGDPNLSDEEVKGAVQYILQAVGVGSLATPPETVPAEKPPVVEKHTVDGKQVYNSACALCHAEGIIGAPKLGDQDSWAPRVAKGMDTLLTHALNGFKGETGTMPPKGGKMELTAEEVKAAIDYMVSQVPAVVTDTSAAEEVAPTPDSPASSKPDTAPVEETVVADTSGEKVAPTPDSSSTPSKPETAPTEAPVVAKDTTPTTEPEPTAKPESTALDLELGEEVYNEVCSICHATGISGAPILENKDNWAPRLKKGMDALFTSALKGIGAMPAKGGRIKFPDEKIKSAVAYMVNAVKGDDKEAATAPTTTTVAASDESATTPSMPKSAETVAPGLPTSAPSAKPEDTKAYHTVQLGESLYGIAARYGQNFSDVTAWNNIKSPYNLTVGQRLVVSARSGASPTSEP